MALPDTLLIGATDLSTLPGIVVTDLSGLWAPGSRRTGSIVIPYADGETVIDAPTFDAYDFEIGVTVLSDDALGDDPATAHLRRAQMISNLRGVASAIQTAMPNGHGTLTRRLATSPSGYVSHTCTALYRAGLAVDELNAYTGQTRLGFRNVTGYWLDGSSNPVWP